MPTKKAPKGGKLKPLDELADMVRWMMGGPLPPGYRRLGLRRSPSPKTKK